MGLNRQDAKKMREWNRRLTQIRKKISHKEAQDAQEGTGSRGGEGEEEMKPQIDADGRRWRRGAPKGRDIPPPLRASIPGQRPGYRTPPQNQPERA